MHTNQVAPTRLTDKGARRERKKERKVPLCPTHQLETPSRAHSRLCLDSQIRNVRHCEKWYKQRNRLRSSFSSLNHPSLTKCLSRCSHCSPTFPLTAQLSVALSCSSLFSPGLDRKDHGPVCSLCHKATFKAIEAGYNKAQDSYIYFSILDCTLFYGWCLATHVEHCKARAFVSW